MKLWLLALLALWFAASAPLEKKMSQKTPHPAPTLSATERENALKKLTPQQYSCVAENGTERAFQNAYWDHKEDGIYVDLLSGEALFSSLDKFDSGTGWPSFSKPLVSQHVRFKEDRSHGMVRTEVRSARGDAHLGHVFEDPRPKTGMRYCINSASLKFVPLAEMSAQGYGEHLFAFAAKKGWETAIIAGGCFWGMEQLLKRIPGVLETQVGYSGGTLEHPKYEQVKTGKTGHAEAVQILFDPTKTSFEKILLEFFRMHDPTTRDQQGNDRGSQYRSAIFYSSPAQKKTAEAVRERVDRSKKWGKPVVTEIAESKGFWLAEDYHQKYLDKNPGGYTCHFIRDLKFE
jgi:peptide methionine sulfoxide reductase msrA/msrB